MSCVVHVNCVRYSQPKCQKFTHDADKTSNRATCGLGEPLEAIGWRILTTSLCVQTRSGLFCNRLPEKCRMTSQDLMVQAVHLGCRDDDKDVAVDELGEL